MIFVIKQKYYKLGRHILVSLYLFDKFIPYFGRVFQMLKKKRQKKNHPNFDTVAALDHLSKYLANTWNNNFPLKKVGQLRLVMKEKIVYKKEKQETKAKNKKETHKNKNQSNHLKDK